MKQLVKGFLNKIYDGYKKFTVTNSCLCILAIMISIALKDDGDVLFKCMLFFATFGSFSFVIEASNNKKLYLYLCGAVVSGIVTYIALFVNLSDFMGFIVGKFIISLYALLLLFGVYIIYKKSDVSFSKFAIGFIENSFIVSLFTNIILLGIGFIFLITELLLFKGIIDYLLNIYVVLLGAIYLPLIIYSLYNVREAHKVTKTILCKVVYSICLIAFLIIYLYIGKVFILSELPKNSLFIIISAIYVATLCSSILAKDNSDGKFFTTINKYVHLAFIPMLGIQIYSLVIRINDYGLTTMRYVGILVIIFEIISIVIRNYNKDDGSLLVILALMVAVFVNVPFINIHELPLNLQSKILEEYKTTGKVNAKIDSAYDYIFYYDYSDTVLEKMFTEEELDKLEQDAMDYSFEHDFYYDYYDEGDDYEYRERDYVEGYLYYSNIDVEDYKTVTYITDAYNYTSDVFDIETIIEAYIFNKDDIDTYFENNSIFYSEDSKLVVDDFSVYYYEDNYEIDYYYISGYIFEK